MRDAYGRVQVGWLIVAAFAALWLFASFTAIQNARKAEASKEYTWQSAKVTDQDLGEYKLAVSPSGTIFLGALFNGVFRSTDDGNSWERVGDGMRDCMIWSIDVDKNGIVFAGTGRGIYRSSDNGGNWVLANKGLPPSTCIQSLFVDSQNRVYAGTHDSSVFQSDDAGSHWKLIGRASTRYECDADSLAVTRKGAVFVGTCSFGLFGKLNGNKRWVQLTPKWSPDFFRHLDNYSLKFFSHPVYDLVDMAVDKNDRIYVAVSINYGGDRNHKIEGLIIRSDDQGKHWKQLCPVQDQEWCNSVAIDANNRVIAGTNNGLFISSDCGEHWKKDDVSPSSLFKLFDNSNHRIAWVRTDSRGRIFAADRSGVVYCGTPRK